MTPKTTKSSGKLATRAQIARGFCDSGYRFRASSTLLGYQDFPEAYLGPIMGRNSTLARAKHQIGWVWRLCVGVFLAQHADEFELNWRSA